MASVFPGRTPIIRGVSAPSAHDVCVIGGGVTGAGIARDLSLRGLSVLLLEKGDWGGGTSGASSWMIHGGPRYLEFDWETTRLSTQDAGHIVTIARNLVYRVVFIIPVLPHDRNNIERMETAMEVYDRFQPLKKAHPHRRLTADEARQAEPGLSPDVIGAVTMEEWGVDPHRLVYANVEDAVAHGARALNHTKVIDLIRDGGKVIGVRYRASDGSISEARARAVVNATGPWSPEVSGMAGVPVRLRPAKGIHIVYPHRISNFSISAESIDGRDLLMVSHAGFTLLGTTDDDFYGDLDSSSRCTGRWPRKHPTPYAASSGTRPGPRRRRLRCLETSRTWNHPASLRGGAAYPRWRRSSCRAGTDAGRKKFWTMRAAAGSSADANRSPKQSLRTQRGASRCARLPTRFDASA